MGQYALNWMLSIRASSDEVELGRATDSIISSETPWDGPKLKPSH